MLPHAREAIANCWVYRNLGDECIDPILGDLMTRAATVVMQNTASIVTEKVQSIKAKRNDKEAIAELTEIIDDLLEKNAQLQSIV